jgi:hypothetical protein
MVDRAFALAVSLNMMDIALQQVARRIHGLLEVIVGQHYCGILVVSRGTAIVGQDQEAGQIPETGIVSTRHPVTRIAATYAVRRSPTC